jgi:hypothetical protein
MVSRIKTRVLIGVVAIAAAVPLLVVMACGPDFQPEVFVPVDHPENTKVFAAGKLGVLQPSYARVDRVVAYRYLTGGKLSDAEKAAYLSRPDQGAMQDWQSQQAALPVNQWRVARAAVLKVDVKQVPEIRQEKSIEIKRNSYVERNDLLNCPDDAFLTAKASLGARVKQWGETSVDLTDWLHGQDAVFSNCSDVGKIPDAAPANASSLLKMDRDYQIASAKFYAGDFDGAVAGFEAIANNKSSPWQPWGEYLAARAEVRKAAMTAAPSDWGEQAKFDPVLLQRAQARLQKVAANSGDRMNHAAEAELTFIEVRLDPTKRLNDSAKALAGPTPDADFAQHMADMLFLTGHNATGDTDMLRWMGFGGKIDAATEWKAKQTQPWLVAALMVAQPKNAGNSELISAAAKVPGSSPAYVTVNYQRARLMIDSGDRAGARKLTTGVLGGLKGDGTDATRNALLSLRIETATSFAEFLSDAPRTMISAESQSAASAMCGDQLKPPGCVDKLPTAQFDHDVEQAFNRQLPLARWLEAAKTSELPQHLRSAIAMAAWLRAQGLEDSAAAKTASALLPLPLQKEVGDGMGFPVTLAILRNEGLKPYLEQGVQRSVSYNHWAEFRDNWWCEKWGNGPKDLDDTTGKSMTSTMSISFLSNADKAAAANEAQRLNELPYGVVWVGRRAIDYVKSHPEDKDAAESLASTVRATRYGCYVGDDKDKAALDQKAVSKEAFTLLHKQYPKSPWTAKTPYYY